MPSPGNRLQSARETMGMDLPHVAEQLHLSRAIVAALEAEDYDKLPARVFVRGYYKNYARLVDLPEEVILREFDDRCPDGDCRAAPPVVARGRIELNSKHKLIRLVSWLIAITLVATLVIWWQDYLDWQGIAKQVGETVQQKQPTEQKISTDPVADNNQHSSEMDADVIPGTSTSAQDFSLKEIKPVQTSSVETPESTPPEVKSQPASAPVIAEITVPLKPELVVMFSGPCWVDIRDSTRQFKLFGSMKDGDMHKLGGEPPYDMVFGDYSVVRLEVNGKPYDLARHANGKKKAAFKFDPAAKLIP